MKHLFFAILLTIFVIAGSAAILAQDVKVDDDPIVATVNGHEIHRSDVTVLFQNLPAQYQQIPPNVLFPQLVEQLVTGHLMQTAGRALDLHNDEAVLARVKAFEASAIQQAYIEHKVAEEITDEKIIQVYEDTVGNVEGPEEVHARHILVKTEDEGTAIIKELSGGADFAALARERSTGPSGPSGGDLGYFTKDAMVEPFAAAAFALDIGAVAPGPVKTQFGWHVIKVIDKRRKAAADLEESRAQIEDLLTREFVTAHMAELRGKAEIETFDLDGSPAGGDAPK